jgi:hypothetical protein
METMDKIMLVLVLSVILGFAQVAWFRSASVDEVRDIVERAKPSKNATLIVANYLGEHKSPRGLEQA